MVHTGCPRGRFSLYSAVPPVERNTNSHYDKTTSFQKLSKLLINSHLLFDATKFELMILLLNKPRMNKRTINT